MDTLIDICYVSVPAYWYEVKREVDSPSAPSLSELWGKFSREIGVLARVWGELFLFISNFAAYMTGVALFLGPWT
jgi:hypothetical protein